MKRVIQTYYEYFIKHRQQILLLSCILLLVCVDFCCWNFLKHTSIYNYFVAAYSKSTGQLSLLIANLLDQYPVFETDSYKLSINGKFKPLIMPTASYQFYFLGFLLLLMVPFKYYKYSIVLLTSSLLFIALRATAITIIQLVYPQHMILLLWIDPLIYIPMVAIIMFVSNKNQIIKPLYDKICDKFSPLINVSLPVLVLLLLLATPIPRVILNYADRDIINELTTMTLRISKIMLGWFGYEAVVTSKFIFLGKFWLRLEQPCLGIGVFTIVVVLVTSVKGSWFNKSIFLSVFGLLFVLMNSIRMAVLLFVVKNTYLSGLNKVELHDNITYFMYLFAFISFFTYYYWFQDINFAHRLKKVK